MKANITIVNVGGLKGEHVYQFERGKVNLIEASNSGGKTSIIKALVAVLSIPESGLEGDYFLTEAEKLGIKTDIKNPQEGFVNIHSDEAMVKLEVNGFIHVYRVKANGAIIEAPSAGEEKFLLGGIISNDSKILRQLHGTDERDVEPDNFRWAVEKLSYASRYIKMTEILKTLKEDVLERKYHIEAKIERFADLHKKLEKLKTEKRDVEKELQKLRPKFKGAENLIDERNRIREEINKIEEDKGKVRGEISRYKETIRELEKEIKELTKKLEKKAGELAEINTKRLEKEVRERENEINKEVEKLKSERSELDGILNLLLTAQAKLRKERDKVLCPLCEDGKISYKQVTSRLEYLRKERDTIGNSIMSLNKEKDIINKKLKEEIEKEKSLVEEIRDLKQEKKIKEMNYDNAKAEFLQLETLLNEYEEKINNYQKRLKDIKITSEDKDITALYNELENRSAEISVRISDIIKEFEESSITINNKNVEPKIVKKIYDKQLEFLQKLIDFSEKRAEEQRQEAARKFNTNIAKLMTELEFKEFRTVKLNDEYKLYIERFNPKTDEYVFQQAQTLSTSEKLTIALILQLSLKETYIPDIPFFIIDDIIEDFDDDRRNKILDYLSQKAKENNWFVISTKLVEENVSPKIRVWR